MTSFSPSRSLGFRRASVALFLATTVAACESDKATAAVAPADDVFAPSNSVITHPPIGGHTNVGVGDTLKLDAANATRRGRNFH